MRSAIIYALVAIAPATLIEWIFIYIIAQSANLWSIPLSVHAIYATYMTYRIGKQL